MRQSRSSGKSFSGAWQRPGRASGTFAENESGRVFGIDAHLRDVAIRFRAGEKGAVALMNEDVQNRVVEGGVGGVAVRFPTAIGQVELDRAADRVAGIEPDDGVGEIRSGGAIPGAELNDLDVIAGDGMELSSEIAGKPARLQFQFARGALRRKERAFVDTRGIAQLGITIGKQHGGRCSVGVFSRVLATKKCLVGGCAALAVIPKREDAEGSRTCNWRSWTRDRRTSIAGCPSTPLRSARDDSSVLDLNVRDRFGRQCLDRRAVSSDVAEVFRDLLDQRAARTREHEGVLRAATRCRKNDQILGEKLRLVRDGRTFQIDRLAKAASAFLRHENNFVRLFVRGDERAEKICRNPPAPAANAGDGPRDCLSQDVLLAEDRAPGARGGRSAGSMAAANRRGHSTLSGRARSSLSSSAEPSARSRERRRWRGQKSKAPGPDCNE